MDTVSRTSIWVAVARAVGAREPDLRVRNPDALAGLLVGPEERALLEDSPLLKALDQPYEEVSKNGEVTYSARSMIARTRFIDESLEAGVRDGAAQVVILGAGFDSRAYRLTELLERVRVFEVDHPLTQQRKIQRVKAVMGSPPENLTYVAVDFRVDDLGEKLKSAGYQRNQTTFFIWEGVTMYLPEDSVRGTLLWILQNSAPGSRVVFDYTYEIAIRVLANPGAFPLPPQMREGMERFRKLVAGEPWIFGIPDRKEEEFLRGLGLEVRKVLGMNSREAVERYLTREDGSIFGGYPASDQQGYLILEAAVPS